jgi:hypothetical protein
MFLLEHWCCIAKQISVVFNFYYNYITNTLHVLMDLISMHGSYLARQNNIESILIFF